MSDPRLSNEPNTSPDPPLEPDAVIERLARLAERSESEPEFYRVVLRDVVQATAGSSAIVWSSQGTGFVIAAQHGTSSVDRNSVECQSQLRETLAGERGRVIRDDSTPDGVAILCPWRVDSGPRGVLELRQKCDISDEALAGQLRFLQVVAELIAIYHDHARAATLSSRERQWIQIDRFAQEVHHPIDLQGTAYAVANEGRLLSDCDRLTVVVRRRGRWKALAVSGSDDVNRRASTIAHLEHLARLTAAHGATVWSGLDSNAPPPELAEAFDDYHEVSSARLVGVLPLIPVATMPEDPESREREPFAALVFERFDGVVPEDMLLRCEAVCRHATTALNRSLTEEEMPLHGLGHLLGRSTLLQRVRSQPWTIVVALVVLALVATLAMVPAPLRVEATGSLEPQTRRNLFAPADSVVEKLLVREAGQHVEAGDELIRLRDPDLLFETKRVLGELETARKQLAGVEAERHYSDRESRSDVQDAAARSAERESLKKKIEGLEQQKAILAERAEKLDVRSPIAGHLLTWDVEQLLLSRPVGRGQILLTVADLEGNWVLELDIPDDEIRDVTAAMRSSADSLSVQFILATAPEIRYTGRLKTIAPATDVRGASGPTVYAVVIPDDQQAMRGLLPGSSVVAKIDCGRHSLLYVATRGLMRAIRSRVLF